MTSPPSSPRPGSARPAPSPPSPAPDSAAPTSLRAVGLFAGIGGIELGLSRAGHRCQLLCELDPGARAVLDARFPDVDQHDDVCTLADLPADTDLVVGGFPCQDLSQAGQTRGIGGRRSGLVFEVFRLLRRRPVPWLVLENVPFMLSLAKGRALAVIVDELEEMGYHWAYRVVDTRAFGLPQRRLRVYLVASLVDDPRRVLFADEAGEPPLLADGSPTACGFYWTEGLRGLGWAVDAIPTLKGGSTIGVPSPPAIVRPSGAVVTPHIRDAERLQGFAADWTRPAEQVVRKSIRWKLVGNAVSVPVAHWLGERLARPGPVSLGPSRALDGRGSWPKVAWNVGQGRFSTELSAWPRRDPSPPLDRFLEDSPKPLSIRATSGFLGRARRSSLRFPGGFLDTLEAHLAAMRAAETAVDAGP